MSGLAAGVAAAAVLVGLHRVVLPTGFGSGRRDLLDEHGATGAATPGCPPWFERMAAAADLDPPVFWWWGAVGAVVVTASGSLLLGGPALAAVASIAATAALLGGLRSFGHRRDARIARSVPASLDAIARSCRAGASVLQALRELADADVGPSGRVFARVAARVDRGESMGDALDELVGRHPVHAVRLAAAALLVGADTGAAPARAVDGVAATLRDHAALEREAAAHATQARASAAVLVLAPVGFGIFAVVADPRVAAFLFRSVPGLVCLSLGASLDAVGAWWMSRLVRGAR